jgi:hypothetical protein
MNLSYNTNLPLQPPVQDRQQALASLASAPRHSPYGSNYVDLSRAYAVENASNYNRAADQANFGYAAQRLNAQQQLALGGLRGMSEEQQRQRDMASSRLQALQGALSALL